jgi:hypothetical protein
MGDVHKIINFVNVPLIEFSFARSSSGLNLTGRFSFAKGGRYIVYKRDSPLHSPRSQRGLGGFLFALNNLPRPRR